MSTNRFNEFMLCSINRLIDQMDQVIALLGAGDGGALFASGSSGAIAASTKTTVVSYTNSSGADQKITLVSASGDADAEFELEIDSSDFIPERRSSQQERNVIYRPPKGFKLSDGSTMTLSVTHFKSGTRTFRGSIIGV